MRQVTLGELTSEVRAQEVRALSELPVELSLPFEQVFEAAGVKPPPQAWTVERLRQLLSTDQYKSMDRPSAQQAILGLLSAEKATVEDIVKDAVARDQAIDAFEGFTRQKVRDRMLTRERKVAQLQEQVRGLQEQCARLSEEAQADREAWRAWHRRKVEFEKGMAWAVGYLLDKPVVSIDEEKETDQELL